MSDPRLDLGQQAYGFFKSKGLPDYRAAALAGNFAWESGGRTDNINPWDNKKIFNSPHSFGVAQWNDRLPGLIDYARKNGANIPQGNLRDVNYLKSIAPHLPLQTQLGYAWEEMQGPEKRAFDTLQGSTDLRSANAGAISYHRPAGWSWGNPMAGHGFQGRMQLADRIMRLGASDLAAPVENFDMYGENVKPSPAPITTGSNPQRTSAMPTDPVTGQWVPEAVIKSQYDRANQFWDTPRATSGLGAIAEGLGGFFGQRERTRGDEMVQGNQRTYQDAVKRATGAKSSEELARMMIASGVPDLTERGTAFLAQNMRTNEAQNTPMAQAQLKAAQIQARSAEENARHAAEMHPAELDLKRAQAEQARRKDAMDEFFGAALGIQPKMPAAQPGVKPMSDDTSAPMPGVILAQTGTPLTAQSKPDISKMTDQEFLAHKAKTDPIGTALFIQEIKKDPSKAKVMWDEMRRPDKVTSGTKTKLEETLSGLVNMRSNLGQVSSQFKPEYLQISNQAQQWWNAVRDKTGIEKLKLDPQETAKLSDFAKFRSSSIGVLNARLKELSGAAVTESEYKRIAAELPNPGTGIADGDSPTQFKAKMDSVIRMANLGVARTHYLIRNGFTGSVEEAEKQMPLDAVPQKMNDIGNQILQELRIKNPGIADDKLIPQARSEVAKQFGMSI